MTEKRFPFVMRLSEPCSEAQRILQGERRPKFRMFVIPDLIQPPAVAKPAMAGVGRSQPKALQRSRIGNSGLCLLCILILSCVLGKAGGTTNEVVNALPPAAADEKPLETGVRRRDPFWPIGFFPASMSGKASEPAQPVAPAGDKKTAFQAANLSGMLRVGGVVKKGNKFYATINGFTVQTGEVISVVADGEVYKFVVERIDFNKVQFKPVRR